MKVLESLFGALGSFLPSKTLRSWLRGENNKAHAGGKKKNFERYWANGGGSFFSQFRFYVRHRIECTSTTTEKEFERVIYYHYFLFVYSWSAEFCEYCFFFSVVDQIKNKK